MYAKTNGRPYCSTDLLRAPLKAAVQGIRAGYDAWEPWPASLILSLPVLDFHAEVYGLHNVQESNVEGVPFCVDLIAIVNTYALSHDLHSHVLHPEVLDKTRHNTTMTVVIVDRPISSRSKR